MDPKNPNSFRFDAGGQALWDDFHADLQNELRGYRVPGDDEDGPELGSAMKAHLGKYPSLFASLALLFALADGEAL